MQKQDTVASSLTHVSEINPAAASTQMKKNNVRVCRTLRQFDVFGQRIEMNFEGRPTYQTNVGAAFSIIMFLVVGAFTALKVIQWITFEEPDFIVNTVLKQLHEEYPEPFEASPNRFDFAFSFLSIKPYKFVQYDPRYG